MGTTKKFFSIKKFLKKFFVKKILKNFFAKKWLGVLRKFT